MCIKYPSILIIYFYYNLISIQIQMFCIRITYQECSKFKISRHETLPVFILFKCHGKMKHSF